MRLQLLYNRPTHRIYNAETVDKLKDLGFTLRIDTSYDFSGLRSGCSWIIQSSPIIDLPSELMFSKLVDLAEKHNIVIQIFPSSRNDIRVWFYFKEDRPD